MEEFFQHINKIANIFKKNLNDKPVKIISHLDADGIAAASILALTLIRENIKFSLSIIKTLTRNILKQINNEPYPIICFLDLGSSNIDDIQEIFEKRDIFILDHHHIKNTENNKTNFINPRQFKIDSDKEISGAGVVYLFSKELNKNNIDLAYLALIGAIGDLQEKNGFLGINKEIILKDAIEQQKVEIKIGLRMFGSQTKQLYKLLQYSTDPYIPGITGNEQAAIQFLQELSIDKDKKLTNLTQEETKELVTAIILKRLGSEETPEDVLGPIYLLKNEEEESPTKDLKEFATLLNSCGRLNKSSLGIGTCLNDKDIKQKAIEFLADYKKEIINSLNWFYKNRNSSVVIEGDGFTIINAEDNIKDTMIGTISSIISKSNIYKPGTYILSLAHTIDEDTKISMRISGSNNEKNLKNILNEITLKFNCESGGHDNAAGCIVPQEQETEFIKQAKSILSQNRNIY